MKRYMNITIWVLMATLTTAAFWGVIPLVRSERALGDICPKIIGIPACYIILACLILILTHILRLGKISSKLFWIGALIALGIAAFGSISNMIDYIPCPKTANGIPMCYLSFLIFGGLVALKIVESNYFSS